MAENADSGTPPVSSEIKGFRARKWVTIFIIPPPTRSLLILTCNCCNAGEYVVQSLAEPCLTVRYARRRTVQLSRSVGSSASSKFSKSIKIRGRSPNSSLPSLRSTSPSGLLLRRQRTSRLRMVMRMARFLRSGRRKSEYVIPSLPGDLRSNQSW